MKNLQDATEKICDLKGSILALDAFVTAFAYALPLEARAELLRRFEAHAEVARTVLLHAQVSEHTIAAFERDVGRTSSVLNASQRLPQSTAPSLITPENTMPKGQQRTNKESKKPKKDQSPSKPLSPGAVMPTTTTVVPDRSKKK